MSMTFNEIASNLKVPGAYAEIDASLARRGLTGKESVGLLLGQKLSTGSAEYNRVYQITDINQVIELTGYGSELHRMAVAWDKVNKNNLFKIMAVEQSEGVAATYTLTCTATKPEVGTLSLMIAGYPVKVTVTGDDTAETLQTALIEAINAETMLPVTAAKAAEEDSAGKITLTAKHKGESGNNIDIRLNYYDNEKTPGGVTVEIASGTKGSGNVSLLDALAALGDEYATDIVTSYTDEANLKIINEALKERFGAMVCNESTLYVGSNGSYAELTTLSAKLNSEHIVLVENYKAPQMPEVRAAQIAAICAFEAQQDPARQYRSLVLTGNLPAKTPFKSNERNLLLNHGVATTLTDSAGNVTIERIVTTYQKNAVSAADEAYLDLTTVKTLIYMRYSYLQRMAQKYPRHKLADDSYPVEPGQAIATPSVLKAEAIALAGDWLKAGLIENLDDFKSTIVSERNALDVNRVDQLLQPDIINNLMIIACKIQFKL